MAKAVAKVRAEAKRHKPVAKTKEKAKEAGREPAPKMICQGLECPEPARWVIQSAGHDPMAMCGACADRATAGGAASYLPAGHKYVLWTPPSGGASPGAEEVSTTTAPAAPAQPTSLPLGDDLLAYVTKGMDAFIPRLQVQLREMCDAERPASEFAQVYINLRAVQDIINGVNKYVDDVEAKMAEFTIPKCFEREHIRSFTTDNGYRVGTSKRTFASILKERRDEAFKWLRANGMPDLITETVNSSTLSATAKSLLENGRDLPDHLFNVTFVDNTSLTKVKK